jgi:hypothetical protein
MHRNAFIYIRVHIIIFYSLYAVNYFHFLLQLPDKTELVIWIPLSSQQRNLYEEFLKVLKKKYL